MPHPKIVLIDGHSLAYRAFHALPASLQTAQGELTNATYGFTSMLLTVLEEQHPTHIIVTFDKGPSFRARLYEEYKAHREKMPEELRNQFRRIRALVAALDIPIVELEDYEADDLLGTLSRQAEEEGLDVLIVTGDRDALQLVDERVTVLTSGRRFSDTRYYTPEKVRERYELSPEQLIDLKALMGDRSDNIPGVKGVGEKGAIGMLKEYGDLDAIYAHLDEHTTRYRNALAEGRDDAYLSRELGRIARDAPVTLDLDAAAFDVGFNRDRVVALMQELGFRSLLNRLPGAAQTEGQLSLFGSGKVATPARPEAALGDYHLVADADALAALVAQLAEVATLTVDTETTSTDPMAAELVGISLTDREGVAWYIPTQSPPGDSVLDVAIVQHHLGPILADAGIAKQGHNFKYDMEVLARHGFEVAGDLFDTMIAEWVINPASPDLGLKNLAWTRLGVKMTPIADLIGRGKAQTMAQVPLADVVSYAGADADLTHRLAAILRAELEERELLALFRDLEMPLLPILVSMERAGVKLDTEWLAQLSEELAERLRALEQEIYAAACTEFNLNSPQQLSEVLFDRLKLPTKGVRKTKSGYYTTRASVLEKLQHAHPFVKLILAHRELSKLQSTYVEALPELVNPETGRVHTSYNTTGTVTGRFSSANPNLQNIPIRTEEGRRVRRAFVAEEGWRLVGADYSQVELRVLAHVSEDEGLIEAFQRDEDIHATTAAAIYDVPLADVTYDQRRIAKAVNFGLVYGQGEYGLSRQLGISVEEARAFIARYFARFPRVRAYMDAVKAEAAERGYVETLLNRRRYFPELQPGSRTPTNRREAALRMAINAPIQGSAADILKLAMLRLDELLRDAAFEARMILQVHDELVLEVPVGEVEAVTGLIRQAMEGAFELRVPLKVDVEVGENWLEMG